MRKHVFHLAAQIAKYRAMTMSQWVMTCETLCKRSVLYRNLAVLKRLQVVQRVSHDTLPIYGYLARPELDRLLGRPEESVQRPIRVLELRHAFAVTETLMELSRYSFVKNIAHECELSPEAASRFSGDRRPDGIIQIERGHWSYEVAVEVETSIQSRSRIERVFSIYREMIPDPTRCCAGVLFVLHPSCDEVIYHAERNKFPADLQSKVLILKPSELSRLKPEIFGDRSAAYGMECGIKCRTVRVHSVGDVQYLPMISTSVDFQLAHLPP